MSSKRAIRRRACGGKKRHPTQAAAILHIKDLLRAGRIARGDGIEPYRCPFGGHFHIGHSGRS